MRGTHDHPASDATRPERRLFARLASASLPVLATLGDGVAGRRGDGRRSALVANPARIQVGTIMAVRSQFGVQAFKNWSGRPDLNRRPLDPSHIPGVARRRSTGLTRHLSSLNSRPASLAIGIDGMRSLPGVGPELSPSAGGSAAGPGGALAGCVANRERYEQRTGCEEDHAGDQQAGGDPGQGGQ